MFDGQKFTPNMNLGMKRARRGPRDGAVSSPAALEVAKRYAPTREQAQQRHNPRPQRVAGRHLTAGKT